MSELVAPYLLIAGPLCFGVCAAVLMFVLFGVAFKSSKKADQLNQLMKIIAWFVGNEAIVLGGCDLRTM